MYLLIIGITIMTFIFMLIKFNIISENKPNLIEFNEFNNTNKINMFKKINNKDNIQNKVCEVSTDTINSTDTVNSTDTTSTTSTASTASTTNTTNTNNINETYVKEEKKYYKKSKKYPKCLEFEKGLIEKINKILDNNDVKTKQIADKLDNIYKVKISKQDLNKGVLKWMLCRNLIKYNKENFTYSKN